MSDGTAFLPIETIPDYAGLGPAVRIQQVAADGKSTSFVVFRSYPTFDRDVRRDAWEVQFHGFDQVYATGIQVGRVPFIPWVFFGFLVMFVGMFMAFFMSHRRYWARLIAAEGGYDLVVAGAARRHQYAFDEEFAAVKDVLATAFGEAESTKDRARALRDARKKAAAVDTGNAARHSAPSSTSTSASTTTRDHENDHKEET